MSESTQGSDGPVMPVIPVMPVLPVIEGIRIRPAVPPPGTIFSLGWLMAELFDPRRRVSSAVRQPSFDADVQLPQVPDLGSDAKLVFLAAELTELVWWYKKKLASQVAAVTGETDKLKAAVAAESVALGEAAAAADAAVDVADGGATPVEAHRAAGATDGGTAFSTASFLTAVAELNQAILDEFADTPERLSAYQLGLALSDLTWLPRTPEPGTQGSPASRPSALVGMFSRSQLAGIKTLLSGAGSQLPASAATIVSQSLDNWADWLDVNTASFTRSGADAWSDKADVVLDALRVQGWVWYSVLIADPEVSAAPSMGAWVQAGSSIARASAKITGVVLRRFWPLVLIALAVLGGLLALVIVNLSGASQVWASLVTVAAVIGASGVGVGSGVSSAFDGVGYEIWSAAKLDASAWNITWLPAMTSTTMERVRLDSRGVAAPRIRKNLDIR
jgi:NAD(P)-dependent dehydrogenase (short-subunit alcohol dehydrogenase family)